MKKAKTHVVSIGLAFAAVALMPVALQAQTSGALTPGAPPAPGAGAPAAKAPSSTLSRRDRDFMMKAAEAGHAEVVNGKLAAANAGHPEVKKFGEHMQQEHAKSNDELRQIAQAKGVKLPEAPDRSHNRMAKQLQGMTGDKFDRVYVREAAVKDHKSTAALFSRQAQKGSDPDVKAFAQKTLPTIEGHLKQANALHDTVTLTK